MPTAALLLQDRGSCHLPKVGQCTQSDGASQGWALHKATAPLEPRSTLVLPRVAGAGGAVAAVAWPQHEDNGLQGSSSSRIPETPTPNPWLLQLRHCWGSGGAELRLLRWCWALGTGTVNWAVLGARRRSTLRGGHSQAGLHRVHPSPINRHSGEQTVV